MKHHWYKKKAEKNPLKVYLRSHVYNNCSKGREKTDFLMLILHFILHFKIFRLWQRPRDCFVDDDNEIWYYNAPVYE